MLHIVCVVIALLTLDISSDLESKVKEVNEYMCWSEGEVREVSRVHVLEGTEQLIGEQSGVITAQLSYDLV